MNLGTDLNSTTDEVAFIMISPFKGYVSTNNNKLNNFDILKFEIKKQENILSDFTILEETTKNTLPNADVTVTDEFGTIIITTQSDNDGKIKLNLEPLTTYTIEIVKMGYETKKINITSVDTEKDIALIQKQPIVTDDFIIIENIYFDFDKTVIKKESELSLNKIIEILTANTAMYISIDGHTDGKGSEKYNQKLSEERAKSAYQYLIDNGISSARLSYQGFGKSQLLKKCNNCSAEQNQVNRRIEFKIIK